jgi:Heparinase II/III-like protein/Heparinase II/III N-terminus
MHRFQQLRWLKHRYHSMENREVLSRLGDIGRHLAMRASLHRVAIRASKQFKGISPQLVKAPITMNGRLRNVTPTAQNPVIETANDWLEHRASFFSLRHTLLGNPIDWQRDYSSGIAAPTSRYSALINYRDSALVGDVKYIWELNRLHQLVPLALAFCWTGKDKYKQEITKQTLSWIVNNPFMLGVNWRSPLEAAIRLISWALVSCLTNHTLPDIPNHQIRETIYQHQYFIKTFYSKHSSANNHLVGEMAGLYVASVLWPLYKESSSWQSLAKQKLIQETAQQVESDGVGKERATEYQIFISEFLLLAGVLGQAIGDPFPEQFWQRLGKMTTFLTAISDRNNNLPMFGDGDSGQVTGLSESAWVRARSLVRLGRLHQEPSCKSVQTDVGSRLLLWGQGSKNLPLTTAPDLCQGLQAFPQGGYYVLSADRGHESEMMVVFDAGQLGMPPLYAHGHADALSFWLAYGGYEFLVDPGTFAYYTHDAWRAYFRSTAAHNTIRVDGYDQSIPGGRFLWSHVANCQVDHTLDNDEFSEVEASHDGYRQLGDPVIHRRCLRLYKKSRTLLITDQLHAAHSHHIEVFFHFSENCQVNQTGLSSFTAENNNARLSINLDRQLQCQLLWGSENPILGWVSRTYGVKRPTFTLVGRARLTGSRQLLSKIAAL